MGKIAEKKLQKLPIEKLPIEKYIVPSYILFALMWVVIAVWAMQSKDAGYQQLRAEMDSLMASYDYAYDEYSSSKAMLKYEPADTQRGDITFRVTYQPEGYVIDGVDVAVYEYDSGILEVLEHVYPRVDFSAFDEPIRDAIDNKAYLNEDGQVKINPDPEKYKMDINIYENENSESGYDIMMWLSKTQVDQTIANG